MRKLFFFVGFLVALPVGSATAQVIKGVVKDASGAPVADASVVLLDDRDNIQRGALTEADGSFQLICPKDGTYKVRVGGAELTTWNSDKIKVKKDETVTIDVLVMRKGGSTLAVFERRRASLPGTFLTLKDIQAKNGRRFTDVLRDLPGVTIVEMGASGGGGRGRGGGGAAGTYTVRLASGAVTPGSPASQCTPMLFVDGVVWGPVDSASDVGPDFKLPAADLAGVELYDPKQVPSELNINDLSARCGVIAVWRRRQGPGR